MNNKTAYRTYLLTLLMVMLAFNYVDRIALGVVLQDVKIELDLTDTQLGLLTGIAFAIFYAVMGIPIAYWADRGNRVTIIALTTTLWSAAVALCGAATSFLQLLLIRIGVAVGEAGCIPPAHSLIADYFSRAERPRAVAWYSLGVPASLSVGYFSAGWLNELFGWRTTFVVLGLPGLMLALLARVTLREPRQTKDSGACVGESPALSNGAGFKDVCRILWHNATFRHLLIFFSIWYFFANGIAQWAPAFFIRSHGLQTGELGTWLAIIYGLGVGVGVYAGGELAARYAAGNEALQLKACAVSSIIFPAFIGCAFLAPNRYLAFAALALGQLGAVAQGPMLATMQTLVHPRMRAMSIAVVYLFANLIGTGLGPLAAGALSDTLGPWLGDESLRYSLALLCPGYFWGAWHLWRASQTVARDVMSARVGGDEVSAETPRLAIAE